MFLPDWIAWGLAEGLVLSVGLSGLTVVEIIRQRRARRRLDDACRKVREDVDAVTATLTSMEPPAGSGEIAIDLLRDRIAALDADRAPVNPQLNQVRRAALSDEAALLKDIQTDELEDALKAIAAAVVDESPDAGEMQDLKDMLKQVTKDSRAMLECIRDLENENDRLRKRLPPDTAGDAAPAGATDAASAPDTESSVAA